MSSGLEALLDLDLPLPEHSYTARDSILYALGVGYGADPLDPEQIAFVYDPELRVAPTMASVLAAPGFWYRRDDIGIDYTRVVQGSERIELHQPLPAAAVVVVQTRVVAVIDKGAGKGALVVSERTIRTRDSGLALATVRQVSRRHNQPITIGDVDRGRRHGLRVTRALFHDRLTPDVVCIGWGDRASASDYDIPPLPIIFARSTRWLSPIAGANVRPGSARSTTILCPITAGRRRCLRFRLRRARVPSPRDRNWKRW